VARPLAWQLVVAVVLLGSLAVLATLQYRWLGDVSEAERERMRAGLRTRTSEFVHEFDGELTRAFAAFHLDSTRVDADAAGAIAGALARWQSGAAAPGIVRDIYLVEGRTFADASLRRFDPARRTLEAARWPDDIAASIRQTEHALPHVIGTPAPMFIADTIDSQIPVVIVPIPRVTDFAKDGLVLAANPSAVPRALVVVLDLGRVQRELLQPLVAKHFGPAGASDYLVTIVRRSDPNIVLYNSGDLPIDASAADVTSGMFDLRVDELTRLASEARGSAARADGGEAVDGARPGRLPGTGDQRFAITIVRRADGPDGARMLMTGGPGGGVQGAWQVRVRYRSGSLDAIVAQSRRRNLAISLGVLGLLGATVVLMIAAAQRRQRLARQQMEFVAAVSHELRTPLAVICSAGENLADGVVAETDQVRRYGTLIHTEGRRLHDMVERVMAFAGITSGALIRPRHGIDAAGIVRDAVASVSADAKDRGVTLTMHAAAWLPMIDGDADALRSAVHNVLDNAIKYSPSGGAVEVHVEPADDGVRLRIADRGIGIDRAELGEIFKPFFRGRRAVDSQARGSGIGLSIVRRVVEAHHGTVSVDSAVGQGTTVTMMLRGRLLHDKPAPFDRPGRRANA
jgi:signal transduction histidine kinase